MLTVIGGLAVMLGSSPLAAQTAASASAIRRAIDSRAERDVHGDDYRLADYGTGWLLTETLPAGFEYGDSELDEFQVVSEHGSGGRVHPD